MGRASGLVPRLDRQSGTRGGLLESGFLGDAEGDTREGEDSAAAARRLVRPSLGKLPCVLWESFRRGKKAFGISDRPVEP